MTEKETSPVPKRRGGNMKARAPEGYYTAAQAMHKLGLNKSAFYAAVEKGKITTMTPLLQSNRYYPKKEIDELADELTLFFLEHTAESRLPPTEFRAATAENAEGIRDVILSLGWQATPASERKNRYAVNPAIDHVVIQNGVVMGYVSAVPFKPDVMEEVIAGASTRRYAIRPSDILPFEKGHTYDVFVGLAERKDVKSRARYGRRLVLGLRQVLFDWAKQGIHIHHLYAHSAEEDGQKLCHALGFLPEDARPGDAFPRFTLDLKTSDHLFAQQYRNILEVMVS